MNGLYVQYEEPVESTIRKDGKKLNVLYIVDQNHQRSVIVVDHSRNFKVICRWWLHCRNVYPGRGNFCLKFKKRKVKN